MTDSEKPTRGPNYPYDMRIAELEAEVAGWKAKLGDEALIAEGRRIEELERAHSRHYEEIGRHLETIRTLERRLDKIPWEEIERLVDQANMHSLVPPEERDFRDQVLARILALREQEER